MKVVIMLAIMTNVVDGKPIGDVDALAFDSQKLCEDSIKPITIELLKKYDKVVLGCLERDVYSSNNSGK